MTIRITEWSPFCLPLLSPFTEKDPDTQSTEAWRLDKVKGVARNANNHYAKYHAGAYGGIPNL